MHTHGKHVILEPFVYLLNTKVLFVYSSEPGSPNAPASTPVKPFHFTTTGDKPRPLSYNDKSKYTAHNS